MRPILFDKNATNFATNGIGRLDCIECKVIEERNGMYELTAVIPESGAHASDIAMSSIIAVKPSQDASVQAFRVYKITKPLNGRFEVFAQHISYQLSFIPVMPFIVLADSTACAETLAMMKTNSAEDNPFDFWTDVTTVASYNQTMPANIRQQLGGVKGSVLDQFGGEYEFDNYTVKLHQHRGLVEPNVTLRYGKNITDINQEESISNTITGICPYWHDTDGLNVVTLPEKVVESAYADNYPFKRTVTVDMSQEFDTAPTEEQLRSRAQDYLDSNNIGIPAVSIKVSFVNLADTEEYKDIIPLLKVSLCDKINVEFEKLGISASAKVVKTTYDVLAERYDSIEVGTVKASLAQTITDTNGAIETSLDKALFATKNATQWLTGSNGYVMAIKNDDGTWKELLFLDTNDAETATNVIRINENGIGFSRNGVYGPYQQAWTMDGKLVIGGTNVPSLSIMNGNTEVGKLDSSGIVWKYTNGNRVFNIRENTLDFYSKDTAGDYPIGQFTAGGYPNGTKTMTVSAWSEDSNDVKLSLQVGKKTGPTTSHSYEVLWASYDELANGDPPHIPGGISSSLQVQVGTGTDTRTLTFKNGLLTRVAYP